jgi:hypothetical protein
MDEMQAAPLWSASPPRPAEGRLMRLLHLRPDRSRPEGADPCALLHRQQSEASDKLTGLYAPTRIDPDFHRRASSASISKGGSPCDTC